MSSYEAICKKITELSEQNYRNMQNLYLSHYDGSTALQFETDLQEKSEAILVFNQENLVGFTTLKVYEHEWAGRNIQIVYSGDTIVDPAHWGQQALAFTWIAKMGELKRAKPDLPMYWFLIVKGHRTYKYLPVFGKSFYPHWNIDRSDLKPLADDLALKKFGHDYNPTTGVVEFPLSKGHLKPDIALPSEEEKSRDAVRFFLQRNPNYLHGHELVCLCEITEENMKPLTRRIFTKGLQ
jgi:hypothetical protein